MVNFAPLAMSCCKCGDSGSHKLLQEDEMLKQLQFFSVASDGRVTLWTLAKSELLHQVTFVKLFMERRVTSDCTYIINNKFKL